MEDVLDVYQRPYDPALPVVCFDETRKELHDTPHGCLPMQPKQEATPEQPAKPGRCKRQDYEYDRQGTASLFVWYEPLAGKRGVHVSDRQTGYELAGLLQQLADVTYSDARQIVLVCDNLKTHSPACLYERFAPEEAHRLRARFVWHYTPEHGSWLNVAESELSVLSRQCLSRRIADKETLRREVAVWECERNAAQVATDWQFTTEQARVKLKRLYPEVKTQTLT